MADHETKPKLTEKGRAEQQAKQDRQAAALRENLKRRKAQARARDDGGTGEPPPGDGSAQ